MSTGVSLVYSLIFTIILYFTCSNYGYKENLFVYNIGHIIPLLFMDVTLVECIPVIIIMFLISLIVVKILLIINNYYQNLIFFFIVSGIIEWLITRFVISFILASILTFMV